MKEDLGELPIRKLVTIFILIASCQLPRAKFEPSVVLEYNGEKIFVLRDKWGVPHIEAKTPQGAFFAQGFVQAEDRLWQMENLKRQAKGTLSEVFGIKELASDKETRLRTYTYHEYLAMYEKFPQQIKLYLKAFVDGINMFIHKAKQENKLPPQFAQYNFQPQPWDVSDPVAIAVMQSRAYGAGGEIELNLSQYHQSISKIRGKEFADALFHDLACFDDPAAPTTLNDHLQQQSRRIKFQNAPVPIDENVFEEYLARLSAVKESIQRHQLISKAGSNAWVISPKRTRSGYSILYAGPMVGFSTPSMCYEIHLKAKGLNSAGMCFPGIPSILIGFNEKIAWTTTSGYADVVDVFRLELDPRDHNRYKYKGEWLLFEKREEIIRYRKEDKLEEIKEIFYRSVYGPVILFDNKNNLAYSVAYSFWLSEWQTVEAFIEIPFSRGLKEFVDAIKKIASGHNMFYADTSGNIGFWYCGRHPIRHPEHSPWFPARGDGTMDWQGFVAFEKIPQAVNPEHGFFANWNNKPSRDWKPAFFGKVFHGKKIIDLLKEASQITLEEAWMVAKEVAHHNFLADYFKHYLIEAIKSQKDLTPDLETVADLLQKWDNMNRDGEIAPKIFNTWFNIFLFDVFSDEIGFIPEDIKGYLLSPLLYNLEGEKSHFKLHRDYFNGEDKNEVMIKSLKKAIAKLKKEKGDKIEEWRYSPPEIKFADKVVKSPRGRGTYMMIVELSTPPRMFSCLPPGQSEDPLSRHHTDQVEIFQQWRFKEIKLSF